MSINNVGERIKILRKKSELTLKDLSEKANISVSFLSDIENGRSHPSLERLDSIAKALNTSTSYLLDESKNEATLSRKDEKDIEKRLNQIKTELMEGQEGLMLSGEPVSPDALQSIVDALEFGMRQAKLINKKYTPKKYRKEDTK
ncbi:helix-turn-helix transcriptional regulator [Clostridiaceae bacterium UIB06]|uniref:Helix-turn-helix transcriptional regulator n=1 Tax=Clostridium thailandense TaxID=2794346 RepID=A0A949TXM2_9CLOT|nr:helix-turn-helix transcriptional regulator [Clostridium thailandense]MBV7275441.1 helix-turn-helix transcriptional regulator [Clostridium thailandense]MCH5136698.1 helix-turn-helix transcriptional regulator [Clostridiaceae bacterium UIB06]